MKDLGDNAKIILYNLQEKTLSPEDLTTEQRRLCVEYIRRMRLKTEKGNLMMQEDMARLFGVSVTTIRNDYAAMRGTYALALTKLDARQIVGGLIESAVHIKAWAEIKEDYRLAWQIECELIEKLMDMGFLRKAPIELTVKTDKADDLSVEEKAAIDAVLLQVKQRRSKERMKKAGLTEGITTGGNGEIINGDTGTPRGDAGSTDI